MIEAQAAGCHCIISENVTREVEVGLKLVESLPLSEVSAWVEAVKNIKKNRNYIQRNNYAKQLINMGFGKKEFVNKWMSVCGV